MHRVIKVIKVVCTILAIEINQCDFHSIWFSV